MSTHSPAALGWRRRPGLLPGVGIAACVAGALSALPSLPTAVAVALLAAFVALGPGIAVLVWVPTTSASLTLVVAPVLGLSLVVLSTTLAAATAWWQPDVLLLALAGAAAVALGCRSVLERRAAAVLSRAEAGLAHEISAEPAPQQGRTIDLRDGQSASAGPS